MEDQHSRQGAAWSKAWWYESGWPAKGKVSTGLRRSGEMGWRGGWRQMQRVLCAKLALQLSPVHRILNGLGDGWEVRDK